MDEPNQNKPESNEIPEDTNNKPVDENAVDESLQEQETAEGSEESLKLEEAEQVSEVEQDTITDEAPLPEETASPEHDPEYDNASAETNTAETPETSAEAVSEDLDATVDPSVEPSVDKMGLEIIKDPINQKVTRTGRKAVKPFVIAALVLLFVVGAYFVFVSYGSALSEMITNLTNRSAVDESTVVIPNENGQETPETTPTPPAEPTERYSVFGELLRRYVPF